MASTETTTTKNHHRWGLVATVVGVMNVILALIDLETGGWSGLPAVYIVSVALLVNAVICFAFARFLSSP